VYICTLKNTNICSYNENINIKNYEVIYLKPKYTFKGLKLNNPLQLFAEEPPAEPKKEDIPQWAKDLQEKVNNLTSQKETTPAAAQVPVPPPPKTEETPPKEEEVETPPAKKKSFLDWLL
jgi:hypothetical protein